MSTYRQESIRFAGKSRRSTHLGHIYIAPAPALSIESKTEEKYVTLTCPNCGNDRNFLVKTLQMHVVSVESGRVEVSEESRPAVLEVLCDECESALKFEEFEDTLRKEVLLTIGAR